MYKYAALSPAIQALEQVPTGESQKQMFEEQLGQMAYATFAAKHPDLVESIITYKTLDSDPEAGSAFGVFILDVVGEAVYIPAVFADSTISPIEIMYVKSRDTFVPFTPDWVREIERGAHQEMGGPSKLPDTVATDVDIRNLVVPPTTGRYSYASARTGAYAEHALDTAPLGRGLMKRAAMEFDPLIWEGFVEQYAKMNGVTPGIALDQGQASLEDLTKLFKGHEKTWGPPPVQNEAAQSSAETPAQAPQAQPAQMPPQPKLGSVVRDAVHAAAGPFERAGKAFDPVARRMAESAAMGGVLGGGTSVYDDDYSDVGSRMARGAAGGALIGTSGLLLGSYLNKHHPSLHNYGDEVGHLVGTVGGAVGAARPDTLHSGSTQSSAYTDPYSQYRYASDRTFDDDGGLSLVKHASVPAREREPKLLDFLSKAPNRVKVAFRQTLVQHPKLLKFATESYGLEPLVTSLRKHAEQAPKPDASKGLRITGDFNGTKAFGERSPLAFRGVAVRGYYYEDSKPAKSIAVLQQDYRNAQDTREPGVYKLLTVDGVEVPALVVQNPIDLRGEDRQYFPKNEGGVSRVKRYIPALYDVHPLPPTLDPKSPGPDVQRSHRVERVVVLGDGKWLTTDRELHGELSTPDCLEGSKLYKALFTDKPPPVRSGRGLFIHKTGAGFYCTRPLELENVSKDSLGVTVATIKDSGGRTVRIDPRASYARPVRPQGANYCTVPATWRWVALSESETPDMLASGTDIIDRAMGRLSETAKTVKVRDAGAGQVSVDMQEGTTKAAAIKTIADRYDVSGADAEAIVKIAELAGTCHAWVVPKGAIKELAKTASVVEQAFSEVLQELGSQMENIQGQMQVLQTVQERAQQLSGGAQGDPNAQQAPAEQPPADPNAQAQAQQDPNAQAQAQQPAQQMPVEQPQQGQQQAAPPMQSQDPSMQQPMDPNAQMEAPPELPMMQTEEPSAAEIQQQINPEFLEQATALNQQGIFDTSALGEIQRAAQRSGDAETRGLGTGNKDLAETVDDLGRTLLTMQLRQAELKTQLSDNTYYDLEEQVRNTFKGLGKLMLELDQHTAALTHVQDETPS